jgi:hypothetical protein
VYATSGAFHRAISESVSLLPVSAGTSIDTSGGGQAMQDRPISRKASQSALGRSIIARLRRGELPQMVDWFDPGLLAKVAVRSVISATLGQYTDQRLMQAATDNVSWEELKTRYDYSGTGKPGDAIQPTRDGAVWVDYIADLGDGFEATYAMAYLLSAETLTVEGEARPLPAGQLLIMGGDQVYPDATKQEYQSRLLDPYEWAFTTDNPQRKLFAIPGNHDWYDGLSSFSALFCSARDRISNGQGRQIAATSRSNCRTIGGSGAPTSSLPTTSTTASATTST